MRAAKALTNIHNTLEHRSHKHTQTYTPERPRGKRIIIKLSFRSSLASAVCSRTSSY